MCDKTSDFYGDMMRDKQRDERIAQSEELLKCVLTPYSYDGWMKIVAVFRTTDGKYFSDKEKEKAIEHQYNIQRGAV